MKKSYVSPSVEVIDIQSTQLMAASGIKIVSDSGTEVNTSDSDVQLGRENNGSSSVWDREW